MKQIENNRSCVVKIQLNDFSLLLTGDIYQDAEQHLLNSDIFSWVYLHTYSCLDKVSLQKAAQNEVNQVRLAVSNLSKRDISCRVVSIGSTPTAYSYENLDGITEVRAGVYTFFDLVMAGIGVCDKTDIASSVVTTIIGQNKDKGWLFIDAGWMALSSDRGTAKQPQDCGYGLVANTDSQIIDGLQVIKANQEHGIIGSTLPGTINFDDFSNNTFSEMSKFLSKA